MSIASACCWTRTPTQGLIPSKDSPFDKQLLEGFAGAERAGQLRSKPADILRRYVQGANTMVAQFSPEHYAKKRRREAQWTAVNSPPDPAAFNFTKAAEAELIMTIQEEPESVPPAGLGSAGAALPPPRKHETKVLVSVSPVAHGHVIFVPRCQDLLGQVLTEEAAHTALKILARSTRTDFRLLFNSLLGFATVNHLHFHGLYLDHTKLPQMRFPVEKVERCVIGGGNTEGRVCIEMLGENKWPVRGFVLSAGWREGTRGDGPEPLADLEALGTLVAGVAGELTKRGIPFNMIMAPFLGHRRRDRSNELPSVDGGTSTSMAVSPDVYIFPRQPETAMSETAGFNAAVCEIAGLLLARDQEAYEALDEATICETFAKEVSLSGPEFDELICKLAWLAT